MIKLNSYYIRKDGKFLYFCSTTGAVCYCNDIQHAESFACLDHAINEAWEGEIVQVQLVTVAGSLPQVLRNTWQRIWRRKSKETKSNWETQIKINQHVNDTLDSILKHLASHEKRLDSLLTKLIKQ